MIEAPLAARLELPRIGVIGRKGRTDELRTAPGPKVGCSAYRGASRRASECSAAIAVVRRRRVTTSGRWVAARS
jgi:hypothetical protein